MIGNLAESLKIIYEQNFLTYLQNLYLYPVKLISVVIDFTIVLFLAYKVFKMLKNTRAWQLLKGIIVLVLATYISKILNLYILNYILSSVMTYGMFLLIVVFQPELRRGLEQIGSTNRFSRLFGLDKDLEAKKKENIYRIVIAATELSKTKTGALIVIERDVSLSDYIDKAKKIYGDLTSELLIALFFPNNPMHDGGVIIQGNRISCAGAVFPTSGNSKINKRLGTRHRAALGIAEETDCIALVVSEETGRLSVAVKGELFYNLSLDDVRMMLVDELRPKQESDFDDEIDEEEIYEENK